MRLSMSLGHTFVSLRLRDYRLLKVFHMCWTSQRARPNSYRFMKSPITRSCICSVLEKHSVRVVYPLAADNYLIPQIR